MDIEYIRDLLIIILYALLIIVIIGAAVGGFIAYRRVTAKVNETVETAKRPLRFAEKVLAYTRGGSKGFVEAVNIIIGRGSKHERQTNQR